MTATTEIDKRNARAQPARDAELALLRGPVKRHIKIPHHQRGDGQRHRADAREDGGHQRHRHQPGQVHIHALQKDRQRVQALHARIQVARGHADQPQRQAERDRQPGRDKRGAPRRRGAVGRRDRLNDVLRRKNRPHVANKKSHNGRRAERAIPRKIHRRQRRLDRSDAAGQAQRHHQHDQHAQVLEAAVPQVDVGQALHAAQREVKRADHGDQQRGQWQADLQHRGDRRRAADVIADIDQQQRVDHDQRHHPLRRAAVALENRAGDGVLARVVQLVGQDHPKQRKTDRRAQHRPRRRHAGFKRALRGADGRLGADEFGHHQHPHHHRRHATRTDHELARRAAARTGGQPAGQGDIAHHHRDDDGGVAVSEAVHVVPSPLAGSDLRRRPTCRRRRSRRWPAATSTTAARPPAPRRPYPVQTAAHCRGAPAPPRSGPPPAGRRCPAPAPPARTARPPFPGSTARSRRGAHGPAVPAARPSTSAWSASAACAAGRPAP
ncbi:conserved hypothetical protein [Ricinus communis]|uniref:Uncharacterized protein n=1 Tax=Ricinus communis TaxID=3988 RepID=B9TA27_RICCO|nr:conserved hypothetical protein [Ricinus communis]